MSETTKVTDEELLKMAREIVQFADESNFITGANMGPICRRAVPVALALIERLERANPA